MVLLFLSVLYPHYYAWWAYFNYVNDEYYKQVSYTVKRFSDGSLTQVSMFSNCNAKVQFLLTRLQQ